MKTTILTLKTGEQIEIRETTTGWVCPICGHVLKGGPAYASYSIVLPDGCLSSPHGAPSFDVCPGCNVEFGNDDYVEGQSVKSVWKHLRIAWLDRIGWTKDALEQLQRNLGITEDQLREELRDTGR